MRRGKKICIALYIIFGVCVVLYVLMRLLPPSFAEFINTSVSAASRLVFSTLSSIVPFSIMEAFVLLAVPIAVLIIVWLAKRMKKYGTAGAKRVIAVLLAFLSFLVSSYVLNGAPGYFCVPVSEKMEFSDEDLTKADLVTACERLVDEINRAAAEGAFYFDKTGATRNPCSWGETALKIEDAYSAFTGVYGFPQRLRSVPKLMLVSPLMTYTHMSGIYCDYTGEININTNYPDYIVVSTIAHELAHQRGISPENEANFMAFAVLRGSDDPYLRYCGCLDAYATLSSELYSQSKSSHYSVYSKLCKEAQRDLRAFGKFFEKYEESTAAKVSNTINDAYLKSQGTSGTVSYDEVTELIIRFYKKIK